MGAHLRVLRDARSHLRPRRARLDRKHLVGSRKQNHSTRYEARTGREEHVASVMNHALGTSRDRAASILHFVESIPDSDRDLLRDYLQRRDGGHRS